MRSAAAHPAQRLRLEHHDVGRARGPHRERVLGPADRLVGGDRDIHPLAQLGQLVQGRARLLGVLEPEPGQLAQHPGGGVHVPPAVGVHPDPAAGAQRVAHRLHPGEVVGVGLAALGDLDLGGPAAGAGHDAVRLLRPDRGHGHVDRHLVTDRRGPAVPGGLQRAGQPAGAFARPVLGERGELRPPGGALDQRALADRDAAEAGAHRDRERAQPRQRGCDPVAQRAQVSVGHVQRPSRLIPDLPG